MSMKTRKYFKWMGAYWSCSNERLEEILHCIDTENAFDMTGCRELSNRPKMVTPVLLLNDGRGRNEMAAR